MRSYPLHQALGSILPTHLAIRSHLYSGTELQVLRRVTDLPYRAPVTKLVLRVFVYMGRVNCEVLETTLLPGQV